MKSPRAERASAHGQQRLIQADKNHWKGQKLLSISHVVKNMVQVDYRAHTQIPPVEPPGRAASSHEQV